MSDLLLAHSPLVLDAIRVTALLLGGVVLGLSIFVFRLYRYAHRLMSRKGLSENHASPYHVTLIAISHALLVLGQLGVLIHRFGGDEVVWWGAPIAILAFSCSIWALTDMLHFENTQISQLLSEAPRGRED